MLIRSQGKMRLVNLDNVDKIGIYEDFAKIEDKEPSVWDVKITTARLGRYSSCEKAIKVLDMIQEFYDKCMAFSMGEDGCYHEASEKKTFQMPQDDEVEV